MTFMDEGICPVCGSPTQADFVDIGVGNTQCGPFVCTACPWSQKGYDKGYDDDFLDDDQHMGL